ncbi:MAG: hypothetical protein ACLGPL_07645, partial [Acidobacteriota bacterium]
RIRCPGLTPAASEVARLVEHLPRRLAVLSYKRADEFLWVVFIGGTGTGKSTIFNALCGANLSEAGVERPKTFGPMAYLHRHTHVEGGFPFPSMSLKRLASHAVQPSDRTGSTGRMLLLEHARSELAHLVLVDTPDVDSLETANRDMVEDLYLLADVVVFVTSQEKYADDVPFRFLLRIHRDGKPCFTVLNKAANAGAADEVRASLEDQGISPRQFFVLPFIGSHTGERLPLTNEFMGFQSAFLRTLSKGGLQRVLREERGRAVRETALRVSRLLDGLDAEREASLRWLDHLDDLFRSSRDRLFQNEEEHFAWESREYIQREIRKHFSKYDLLRKPRRFISQAVLAPLRMLGLVEPRREEPHEAALQRIRKRMDFTPIQAAVEHFNRSVLEKLSPPDDSSPLYRKLRDPGLVLSSEEIRAKVLEGQDRLILWLEERFQNLARGIPKSQELGIYSASILWGGLVLALETAIGGGISILEAVLDTAIAPFVTQGAVELFAYQELKKIARELAERYRLGLISVLREQRDHYAECIESLTTPPEAIEELREIVGGECSHGRCGEP